MSNYSRSLLTAFALLLAGLGACLLFAKLTMLSSAPQVQEIRK